MTYGESHGLADSQKATVRRVFHWSGIEPASVLKYEDCYDGLQCARLEVPMDYEEPEAAAKVVIATIRRPARVPVTSLNYGGAILTNPGGPGGSGVEQQLSMGEWIQNIVDAERNPEEAQPGDKYFDIISFDPRGVNHTTPTISCFPNSVSRATWNLQAEAEGILGSSENSLRTSWRRATALATGCSEMIMSNTFFSVAEHADTASVAADMVTLVEKHGEWRQKEVQGLQDLVATNFRSHSRSLDGAAPAHWSRQEDQEKLQYWGFSYGTLLGSTFAAKYPERVERMVLDGVVEMEDYYQGPWEQNLADTDKILARFFDTCAAAGHERCSFWREGGPTVLRKLHNKLLHDIKNDPLALPGTATRGPEVITWSDLKLIVKDALYQPLHGFPVLAEMLDDMTNGNGSKVADFKYNSRKSVCGTAKQCSDPFSQKCVLPGWSPYDALPAVLCTDAKGSNAFTEDSFRTYWRRLQNKSEAMGDYWAATLLTCAGWKAESKHPFTGLFGGNTSHPILFIGNTLDPVTPFGSAEKMAERFEGSGLLRQDSEGHCSFTEPSICTARAVREYFQTGGLPEEGTVCEADAVPFFGWSRVLGVM
ncbi:hypothetical protein EJ03DRAFT_344858 [Teratosphaeria nubilosa]|uniref:Peptidase S33 tripeptidyl aminopeptidase-like C-terminal domain-containing protein n=1 Tax=Teratosphaeria nubilosa TaxID=161662 RepID=A0A6G1L3T3_9PEZI|nr:hypothetical protein EJ03DRAFT_344858 [Teratosphaeria nubilosa]